MARAVYEGLSYVIRECLEATAAIVSELRVCGGGARSSLWCQMIADIVGVRVLRSAESEIGARGAFFFGLTVTGEAANVDEVAAKFPLAFESFEPSGAAGFYGREYGRFLTTRETVRTLWRQEKRA
jgi:xylulokinase